MASPFPPPGVLSGLERGWRSLNNQLPETHLSCDLGDCGAEPGLPSVCFTDEELEARFSPWGSRVVSDGPAYNPAALNPLPSSFQPAFGSSQRHHTFSASSGHRHSEMDKEIQMPFGMSGWHRQEHRGGTGNGVVVRGYMRCWDCP